MASLHDASPSASSSPGAICGPLVMIGPVLEEVIAWITESQALPPPPVQSNNQSVGGLLGLLAGLGISSTPTEPVLSESSDLYKGWNIGSTPQRTDSGIDFCTGVELHLIISNPQVSSSFSYALTDHRISATAVTRVSLPLGRSTRSGLRLFFLILCLLVTPFIRKYH